MSAVRIAGLVLIVIGLIGLLWGGISWTEERTVVDLGPIESARAQEMMMPMWLRLWGALGTVDFNWMLTRRPG